jgi:hypothetical protein
LQTYNLELIKGGCENAIEVKILIGTDVLWKKAAQKIGVLFRSAFIFYVYSTVEYFIFRIKSQWHNIWSIDAHLQPIMVD